jgi:hypothetical protein
MCFFEQTSEARKKVYKAIVEAKPPGLDFIHAATQVSSLALEIFMDSVCCRTVHSSCSNAKSRMPYLLFCVHLNLCTGFNYSLWCSFIICLTFALLPESRAYTEKVTIDRAMGQQRGMSSCYSRFVNLACLTSNVIMLFLFQRGKTN